MRYLLIIFVCLIAFSCSSLQQSHLNEEKLSAVDSAEKIGTAIYEKDLISARATDVLFENQIAQNEKRVQGWVTLKVDDGWLVRFVGKINGKYFSFHDVNFSSNSPEGVVKSYTRPTVLSQIETQMFLAREAAIRALPRRCSDRYNTVVLSGSIDGAEGWIVYLLAATTTPNEIVVGGHYRFDVSQDGLTVLNTTPLSKTCLSINSYEKVAKDHEVVGALVTHVISDTPIETHVYLSLLHDKRLLVATSLGDWIVYKGKIEFINPRK